MLRADVRAIFLGAGRGSRLLPYTAECPKWQLDVGGQKILERLIGCAHECGIADVVVVRGSSGGSVRCPSVQYVEDHDAHNMVHSLFKARQHLTGEVVISYADILYEPGVLQQLLASDAPISVVVDLEWESLFRMRADDPIRIAESLSCRNGRIASIGQPLKPGEHPEAQYLGLIRLTSVGAEIVGQVYDDLKATYGGQPWRNAQRFEDAYMTDFLQELVERQVHVQAVPIRNGWLEFDTPRDYEHVVNLIATHEIDQYLRLQLLPANPSVLSAGGVVAQRVDGKVRVVLVGDGSADGWRLPKGMQAPGEPINATAVREVKEETGLSAELMEYIGRAQWTYEYDQQLWDHRVHFFLMRPVGGSLDEHDSEFVEVQWAPIEEAQARLRFESERRIVADAQRLLLRDGS